MKCFIINLDRAQDRWNATAQKFRDLGFDVVRVPAVDGKTLERPFPDFSPFLYFCRRGRPISAAKVACFQSHLKALRTFLETGDEFALICEDDVTPLPELPELVEKALEYRDVWNFLRLNGIKATKGVDFAVLSEKYRLGVDLKTASGNGAKIVDREAARLLLTKTLPIRLPHDVTLFYDLPISGIREVSVRPFPIVLNAPLAEKSGIGGELPPRGLRYALGRLLITTPTRVFCRSIRKTSRIYWATRRRLQFGKKFKEQLAALENKNQTLNKNRFAED